MKLLPHSWRAVIKTAGASRLRNCLSSSQKRKLVRSPSYRRELKYTLPRFEPLHNKLVSRVTPAQIDEQTSAMTPSARNAKLRVLRAAFNFGIKRDYLARNPIEKLDFESLPRSEVE